MPSGTCSPGCAAGNSVTEYRASLDAAVSFSNGGDLIVHGFRVDLPSPDVDDAEIAALPLRIEATGTIPVRAFARLPD
jgi:hypothetical protein